jgi:hypothetical protein
MAGANRTEEMRAALGRLLYDQEFRHTMLAAAMGADRRAEARAGSASRAAAAVLDLVKESTN